MNEIFNGFVTQPYFSKYIILKRARKSQQHLYLYRIRFMPTIIQGIMIFMNEFDFSTTPLKYFGTHTCPCLIEVGLLSIIGPSNSI